MIMFAFLNFWIFLSNRLGIRLCWRWGICKPIVWSWATSKVNLSVGKVAFRQVELLSYGIWGTALTVVFQSLQSYVIANNNICNENFNLKSRNGHALLIVITTFFNDSEFHHQNDWKQRIFFLHFLKF